MKQVSSRTQLGLASLVLALAIADVFIWRQSIAQVMTGERFAYWSHVHVMARAPFALVWFIALALWIFLRGVWGWLNAIRWWTVLLVSAAWLLFTLVAPLATINQIAHHWQSVAVADDRYHLYYQFDGIGTPACEYVLVRCDRFGLVCRQQARWDYSTTCLSQYADIQLRTSNRTVYVIMGDDVVFEE